MKATKTRPIVVIVESPSKAKTLSGFLGDGYQVIATRGHVRDLPKSRLAVDVEGTFQPDYIIPLDKRALVRELKSISRKAPEVVLATDPDREGEAIAWHICHVLNLPEETTPRVVFHEITAPAIRAAFTERRQVDVALVQAQQARRVLDRLVGYKLSPLLWHKVQRKTSAGRVQSAALHLITQRQREIDAFVPVTTWTISGRFRIGEVDITSELVEVNDERAVFSEEPHVLLGDNGLAKLAYRWEVTPARSLTQQPPPPFTTSTLQQEAARRLGFSPKRTMSVAQELYEGIDVGDERVGAITYPRTDSTHLSEVALAEIAAFIVRQFGAEYGLPEPRHFRTQARVAQEAHEAIRPTSIERTPTNMKRFLSDDAYKLYDLIWKRTLACQMAPARIEQRSLLILGTVPDGQNLGSLKSAKFRLGGSQVRFPGFWAVLNRDDGADRALPNLTPNDRVQPQGFAPHKHVSQPPAPYSDGTLVKALEDLGIGRPSTYASILATIVDRGYVEYREKTLFPTHLGVVVDTLLSANFAELIDSDFTARLEEQLDVIARSEGTSDALLRDFYTRLSEQLTHAEQTVEKVVMPVEELGEPCPVCSKPLVVRRSRFGRFAGCSGYPECRYHRSLYLPIGNCPVCDASLCERRSRKGKGRRFYGCSRYPECTFVSWNPPKDVCPTCGKYRFGQGNRVTCPTCEGTLTSHQNRETAA